ncbi:heme-binding domain-containing protein [Polaribacter sp. KT 15]|uniref:heme-binding domain-containing protein n=1 Tax=Polaribacter sp. KT 15 TaxID=1896175 RepID=UPI00090CC341|nr:heme-binding domain-containing protein [Polaribacter sp. KT 15]SHM98785.1 Haem-binding domain-containing protein [Polaribacter sp. KT 15]
MKTLKKILVFLLVILVIAQFFGPEKNDGEMTSVAAFVSETNPPEDVKKVLETTCYDCHSDKTVYPWYSNITPVNYWLDDHIKDGKKHLNFSKWSSYSLKKKEHKMDELYEEVEKGEMPLDSYTWTHADANLTQEQINAVVTWGKKVQADYKLQMNSK